MKISHFPKWCVGVYNAISMVEVMIVIAIIGLLTAIAVPNFIKAKEQAEKNKIAEQQKKQAQDSFSVGDTVKVKGLDRKGTINYLGESGFADVLVVGNNGEPAILKDINLTLISK